MIAGRLRPTFAGPKAKNERGNSTIRHLCRTPAARRSRRRVSEAENILFETQGVTIDRSQMRGIKAAVAATLEALDDPSAV
jgi:hypothetical protein